METSYLQEYVALAKRRSFTETARELHLTQSTLSKHVAALEREFGVELFTRDRNGVSLTEAGALLYTQAVQINHALQQTRHLLEGASCEAVSDISLLPSKPRRSVEIRHTCSVLAKRYGLSLQETGALALYFEEQGFAAIQAELDLSRDEVAELLASAYRKLNVRSKQDALNLMYSVSECS